MEKEWKKGQSKDWPFFYAALISQNTLAGCCFNGTTDFLVCRIAM